MCPGRNRWGVDEKARRDSAREARLSTPRQDADRQDDTTSFTSLPAYFPYLKNRDETARFRWILWNLWDWPLSTGSKR